MQITTLNSSLTAEQYKTLLSRINSRLHLEKKFFVKSKFKRMNHMPASRTMMGVKRSTFIYNVYMCVHVCVCAWVCVIEPV